MRSQERRTSDRAGSPIRWIGVAVAVVNTLAMVGGGIYAVGGTMQRIDDLGIQAKTMNETLLHVRMDFASAINEMRTDLRNAITDLNSKNSALSERLDRKEIR